MNARRPTADAATMPMPTMAIGVDRGLLRIGSAEQRVADRGSSRMRWALLPPKPNADTPARSTPSAASLRRHGSASRRTRKGEPRSDGNVASTCSVGGLTS